MVRSIVIECTYHQKKKKKKDAQELRAGSPSYPLEKEKMSRKQSTRDYEGVSSKVEG